ncbi:MAG: reverse transcriptase family protein, partial [Pseudomonadota bacterium]
MGNIQALCLASAARKEFNHACCACAEIIEKSESAWSSPLVLVRKKDGSTRCCVDYRRLNEVTLRDSYPIPRIDDSLDALSGARWFSTLDLKSGYHQVKMSAKDKPKTAFSCGSGLWEFRVMPFGLCNAPATFERLMEAVLAGLHWKSLLVYLDDVIVFGSSFAEAQRRLTEVLERFRAAGLKLNPK